MSNCPADRKIEGPALRYSRKSAALLLALAMSLPTMSAAQDSETATTPAAPAPVTTPEPVTTDAPAATQTPTATAPAATTPVAPAPTATPPVAPVAATSPAADPAAPAATETTAETAPAATTPAPDAAEATAATGSASIPGATTPETSPAAASPAAQGTTPVAEGAAPAQPVPAPDTAAAEPQPEAYVLPPMPSPFADPVGFGRYILSRPERPEGAPHDLSPWGMYMAADIVVKLVMLGLAFASLVTWTVFVAKSFEIAGAKARVRSVLKVVQSSRTLDQALRGAGGKGGPAALMLRAAKEEAEMSDSAIDDAGGEGLKERVGSALNRIEAAAGRRISKGTGVLATIGSTAPFVGLFGTVWGIMNSFISISESQTTNLAVVAPGIAEALLATGIGLVAAIPAVVIYNVFARSIAGYRLALGDVAAGVERLVSRDLDFRHVPRIEAGRRIRPNVSAAE